MSLELLDILDSERAFEPTRRFEDLPAFHVPFDRLVGDQATEATLRGLAERQGKIALVGPSGAGKSSVIASVVGPLAEDLPENLVPIRIPVAATDARTIEEPVYFAQHLLRTVIRYSSEILPTGDRKALEKSAADQVTAGGAERSLRGSLGTPKLVAEAGFSAELKSGAEQIVNEISASGAVDSLARLAEIFHARGREPFWIIDDSDRWLRISGEDLVAVAETFFRRIVPMLAREIDCGFVIAIHDEYLDLPAYRETVTTLSRVISLPHPPDLREALSTIIGHRVGLFTSPEADGVEIIDGPALDLLASAYADSRSLRTIMALLNRAVQLACTDRVERLDLNLLQTAVADLS